MEEGRSSARPNLKSRVKMGYKQDDRPIRSAAEFTERLKRTSARETADAREERKRRHPDAFAPGSSARRRRP